MLAFVLVVQLTPSPGKTPSPWAKLLRHLRPSSPLHSQRMSGIERLFARAPARPKPLTLDPLTLNSEPLTPKPLTLEP
jgi:hypothetical protein